MPFLNLNSAKTRNATAKMFKLKMIVSLEVSDVKLMGSEVP